MAKPDIQKGFVTASGTVFRDDGKLGLESKGAVVGPDLFVRGFSSDGEAAAAGVQVGELYHDSGDLKIRLV